MVENAMDTIAALLPETVIYEAACKYLIKLSETGELDETENLFKTLYKLDPCSPALAEATRRLVSHYLSLHDLKQALYLYGYFSDCCNDCAILTEKIMTAHLLVHALLEEDFQKAYGLWAEYQEYDLNSCLGWHWAQTGIALLKFCYKNDFREMAIKINSQLHEHGEYIGISSLIKYAERIMAKFNLPPSPGRSAKFF